MVTLRDVFALAEENSFLRDYLHHHWIDELLSEAKSTTQSPTEINPQSVEYLELDWPWA
jgi:hypothetical protein